VLLIKGGKIHNAIDRESFIADILVKNGKIETIGTDIVAEDATVIDASGKEIYPGFIDAHCHIGLSGLYGVGKDANEVNERNDITSPHLRAIDAIDPTDRCFEFAREAGVTCVCTGPGSLNVLGGTFAAIKTVGKRVDSMAVKTETAMKCAFGENPKNGYLTKTATTRMTTTAILRDILTRAKRYQVQYDAAEGDTSKLPAFDIKLHSLLPVMRGDMPLKAHAHQANDIFTALRIAEEFGLKLTLEHVTEGHLIADELAKTGVYMAVGPSMMGASKYELRNKSWTTPAALVDAGCHVCIITDSPVTGQQYLPICAAFAIRAGLDPFYALKAITINAAEHIGIADRVGSIEKGKDADIVITNGSPFEIATLVEHVIIDGQIVK